MKKILLLIIGILCLTACSSGGNNKVSIYEENTNNKAPVITYETAQTLLNEGAIIIDVRTKEEYDEEHIEGALLLPLDEITIEKAKDKIPTQDTKVIIYCRSGNRSAQAGMKLKALGYTNIYDLGAITNWK